MEEASYHIEESLLLLYRYHLHLVMFFFSILSSFASPLEFALVSCCVRLRDTATITVTAATKDTSTSKSSMLSPSAG